MSTPNLEAKIALAWETFADYSNNEEKTDSAWFVRNAYGYCGAVWFVTQAINESTANNTWQTDSWEEYAAFSVLALAAYLFHRYG